MKTSTFLILLILFMSCKTTQKARRDPDVSILNTRWIVETINGETVDLPDSSQMPYIIFKTEEPKQVSGGNGCNSFFGGYEISGDTLKFKDLTQTLRACSLPYGEVETKFMEMLFVVQTFRIEGEKLIFLKETNAVAEFRK